jgi:hypothetical protein
MCGSNANGGQAAAEYSMLLAAFHKNEVNNRFSAGARKNCYYAISGTGSDPGSGSGW